MPFRGWLGSGNDEGRGKLRKAQGRRRQPLNLGLPNYSPPKEVKGYAEN